MTEASTSTECEGHQPLSNSFFTPSPHTQSFLFGLTAALRHMLNCYEANSPETDLAVELLLRESRGKLDRQQAITRLWCVLPVDLTAWMVAKRPQEQSRADRRRILTLCAELAALQYNPFNQRTSIIFSSLTDLLGLDDSDGEAAEDAANDSIASRRSSWVAPYMNLQNWDWVPVWLLYVCDFYTPILEIYRVGSTEWYRARERFMEDFFGENVETDRTLLIHALSYAAAFREHSDTTHNPFDFWPHGDRMHLLAQAVDVATVEPKITRRKLRVFREFAKRLDLPEFAVQEVLDQRAAEQEVAAE